MDSVTLAEAKARLGELVEQAAAGNPVRITRRGRVIAQITPVKTPRKRIDTDLLRELTDSMTPQPRGAAEWMRTVRGDEQY